MSETAAQPFEKELRRRFYSFSPFSQSFRPRRSSMA